VNSPWRIPILAMLVMALMLAACGGGGGGGNDAESDLPDSAEASSEDADGTVYPLREGRYRLSYRAPGCEDVVVSVTSADGAFTYEQTPRGYTSFINDMIDGEYTVQVTSDCDEWTINLNEF
jgi:ABC-type glycerol-3-phosphate transport system substrate-binding protein